jgi:hypothetical protein
LRLMLGKRCKGIEGWRCVDGGRRHCQGIGGRD